MFEFWDLVIVFALGLIVGSFLNAVIYRLHTGESVMFERSHCPHCNHELSASDLVPLVSFISLVGKCRYCKKPISWQYPIVELATATTFVLLAQNLEFGIWNLEFWYLLTVICFLIVIAVYDYKHYLILDKVVFPALALSIAWNLIQDLSTSTHYSLLTTHFAQGLFGALLVSGFFAVQYYASGGKWIGFGDVKLGLFLGTLFGVSMSIVMLFLAYFLGAVVGIGLILMNRKTLGSKLPFGVFLSISAIIMILYGQSLTDWYFGLIGLR